MSEYHDRHTISRLIGAAPGYVGFEEGGMLSGPVIFLTALSDPLSYRPIDGGDTEETLW